MELPSEEVFRLSEQLGTVTAKGGAIFELIKGGEGLGEHGVVKKDSSYGEEPENDFKYVFVKCEEGGTLVSINLKMDGTVRNATIAPRLEGEFGNPETFKENPVEVKADIDKLVTGL